MAWGGLNISGLDSLTQLQLLQPAPSAAPTRSLHSRLALRQARASLALRLTVTPAAGAVHAPPLSEDFELPLGVRELSAAALLLVSLSDSQS